MGSHNAGKALDDLHCLAAQIRQPHACQRQPRLKESSHQASSNIAQHLSVCDISPIIQIHAPLRTWLCTTSCWTRHAEGHVVASPFMSMIQMDLPPGTVSLSRTSYI